MQYSSVSRRPVSPIVITLREHNPYMQHYRLHLVYIVVTRPIGNSSPLLSADRS
jgi:hypothetical protein